MKNKSFVLTISAPPGGGKGTQAKLLSDTYNSYYLASGDIIREMKEQNSDLAKQINSRYKKGIPQPDSVIKQIFLDKMQKLVDSSKNHCFVLDTFPLSLSQAISLEDFCHSNNLPDPHLIYLKVNDGQLIKRMTQRLFCNNCGASYKIESIEYTNKECSICHENLIKRQDDKISIIKNRLSEFKLRIKDILDYYKTQDKLIIINGLGSIEEIHQNIVKELIKQRILEW